MVKDHSDSERGSLLLLPELSGLSLLDSELVGFVSLLGVNREKRI